MTAYLKIDECEGCRRALPWEWIPAVSVSGKPLAGTGVWRSQLTAGQCGACLALLELQKQKEHNDLEAKEKLIHLLEGAKPYREFTFDRYDVMPGNRLAYERCKEFCPGVDNLYLWGACGVGKTHLAWSVARRFFEESLSVVILRGYLVSRKLRMKEPAQEQTALDELVGADLLVLDDLGSGSDSAFTRQILQEIFDRRYFAERAGILITSKYSLDELAAKFGDDSIPSRLSGMCNVIEVKGDDRRLLSFAHQ